MAGKNLKLIYFDSRGRGEPIRLILALSGQKYEDVRLTHEEWEAEKPNTPFGQLLEIDGERFGQSVALANYAAKLAGIYGKDILIDLKIDQIVQQAQDFINAAVKAITEKDETKKAELIKTFKEVDGPKYLDSFEKRLKSSGTGYFVGDSVTHADILVYDLILTLNQYTGLSTEGYPFLQDLPKKVESNEKIKAYIATRKPVN